MTWPSNTILIEGTFDELSDELAQYFDSIKPPAEDGQAIQSSLAPLLKSNQKDEALKVLVTASSCLNSAPEREFIAAYNLLIHLFRQSSTMGPYLRRVCQNLSTPVTSSPVNGAALALSVLGTIFNILEPEDVSRYHVLIAILRVIRATSTLELIRPQLPKIDSWVQTWDLDDKEQSLLYQAIADVAQASGEVKLAYDYLTRALCTTQDAPAEAETRKLALRALKSALLQADHFDFHDLIGIDCIQQLSKSDPIHFELLKIFNAELVDDFVEFRSAHAGWLESEQLDEQILLKKIRLLTLASLGASAGASREISYEQIAESLQVAEDEVEDWIIDGVRANLIEGRIAQLEKRFLVQRATYRVFGESQWREVEARLAHWRNSLTGVLSVIRTEKEKLASQRELEIKKENERKATKSG